MAEADLILNITSFKVGCEVETGPGLISTSPANRQRVSKEDVVVNAKFLKGQRFGVENEDEGKPVKGLTLRVGE